MTYRAPVADIAFALKYAAGLSPALAEGLYGDLSDDVVDAVLEEAGKFATDVIAPLNPFGDRMARRSRTASSPPRRAGRKPIAPGRRPAGTGSPRPAQWGGQDLPLAVNAACIEMWNSAAMAFGLGPLLTMAAIDALVAHGSDELKGPICPSSSPANGWARCSSPSRRPAPTSARCAPAPSAPPTAAIASRARRSSSPTASTISPTTSSISCWRGCPMRRREPRAFRSFSCPSSCQPRRLARRAQRRARAFDRAQAGHPCLADLHHGLWRRRRRVGFLIGEENRGMACMFTMMNQARLSVALQEVAIAIDMSRLTSAYCWETLLRLQ